MAAKGKIVIDRERCKGCHLCIEVCPKKRIVVDEELNKKGYQPAMCSGDEEGGECNACCMCALVCPDVAIEVYRAE